MRCSNGMPEKCGDHFLPNISSSRILSAVDMAKGRTKRTENRALVKSCPEGKSEGFQIETPEPTKTVGIPPVPRVRSSMTRSASAVIP